MEALNTNIAELEKIISDVNAGPDLESCVKSLNSLIPQIKKIFEKLSYEKGKNSEFTFSIITQKIIDSLEELRYKQLRFEISYGLSRMFDYLLSIQYFEFICESKILIYFINSMLNLIENTRGALIYQVVIRKAHLYMNFVFQKNKPLRKIISELMKSFSIHHSANFKNFQFDMEERRLPELCGSDNSKDKESGITQLVELISSTYLTEQFELFYLSAPDIVTNLLKDPSEEYNKAYSKFGNLLCTLLFPSQFKVFTESPNPTAEKNPTALSENMIFLMEDKVVDNLTQFEFMNDKKYQLTFQKEILDLNDKIVEVCLIYVTTMTKFDKIFPLQYINYLILRRIYFTFPQYKNEISDLIISTLSNLCKFQGQFEWNTSLESRQFAYYLLSKDQDLSKKIKSATAVAPFDIRYENLILKNANLTIGFNNIVNIEARSSAERKIEILEENSLVYISFGMEEDEDKDITVLFSKYDSKQMKWIPVFAKEKTEFTEGPNKIILYVKEPCVYKIIFDNTYSWLTSKKILYRIVYLRPLENDDED